MAYFKHVLASVCAIFLATPLAAEPYKTFFPEDYAQIGAEYKAEVDALDLRQGQIMLEGGMATVTVPEGYYFLGPKDARYVLSTVWGNPDDPTLLGMIFRRDQTPYAQGGWGLTLQFDPMGYVSDSDAETYDYASLLKQMQSDTLAENPQREKDGYQPIELLGWAATPHYEKGEHKLYWAKKLRFGDDKVETLNYNIRGLGRKGVLVANFIATMDELPAIEAAAPDVMKMISFTEGNRYSDFVAGTDAVADVGIGGLIAGGALANAGLIAVGLVLLKKFGVLLVLPVIGAWKWLTKNRTSS